MEPYCFWLWSSIHSILFFGTTLSCGWKAWKQHCLAMALGNRQPAQVAHIQNKCRLRVRQHPRSKSRYKLIWSHPILQFFWETDWNRSMNSSKHLQHKILQAGCLEPSWGLEACCASPARRKQGPEKIGPGTKSWWKYALWLWSVDILTRVNVCKFDHGGILKRWHMTTVWERSTTTDQPKFMVFFSPWRNDRPNGSFRPQRQGHVVSWCVSTFDAPGGERWLWNW